MPADLTRIRAGLRARLSFSCPVNQHEADKLRWLKQAWDDGVNSGDYGQIDIEAIKAEGRKRLATKA